MKISDVAAILDAKVLVEGNMDTEVKTACGSDMMSDVLAFVKDQSVLLTGLMNPPGGAHSGNDGYALHCVCPGQAAGRDGSAAGGRPGYDGAPDPLQNVYRLRKVV